VTLVVGLVSISATDSKDQMNDRTGFPDKPVAYLLGSSGMVTSLCSHPAAPTQTSSHA
jgi:hypothetical protein